MRTITPYAMRDRYGGMVRLVFSVAQLLPSYPRKEEEEEEEEDFSEEGDGDVEIGVSPDLPPSSNGIVKLEQSTRDSSLESSGFR